MKPFIFKALQVLALVGLAIMTLIAVGFLFDARSVHALPEYTERTGESCGVRC